MNLCCQFIIYKGQDCRLQIKTFRNVSDCFAMKMPVYKPEGNKLTFLLKKELYRKQYAPKLRVYNFSPKIFARLSNT